MAADTRTGIVTGGSGGIGRVPAERLTRDVRVVIAHSGNRSRAEEVVVAIGAAGGDEISLPSKRWLRQRRRCAPTDNWPLRKSDTNLRRTADDAVRGSVHDSRSEDRKLTHEMRTYINDNV